MGKKEKSKLIFLFLGIVAFVVVFWFVLRYFEGGTEAQMAGDFLEEGSDAVFAAEKKTEEKKEPEPAGTLKLAGKKFDYYDDLESYLMIGTDASGDESGENGSYQGNMADFLLLLIVDKTTNEYGMLQLNRDTMTKVTLLSKEGTGHATANIQLCTAHWFGGTPEQSCENTVKAVSDFLGGLPISGYYALNMDMIPELNHEVGGVKVKLEEDFTDVDPSMKKGRTLRLTDDQAYHYIHDRYGVGDETNVSRMARQKQYMKSLFSSLKEKMKDDSGILNTIFGKFDTEATTDLKPNLILKLTNQLNQSKSKGTKLLEGESKIGQALGDGIDHSEFYPSNESLIEVMTSLCNLQEK